MNVAKTIAAILLSLTATGAIASDLCEQDVAHIEDTYEQKEALFECQLMVQEVSVIEAKVALLKAEVEFERISQARKEWVKANFKDRLCNIPPEKQSALYKQMPEKERTIYNQLVGC